MLPWTRSPKRPSVVVRFCWIQIFNLLNGVSTFLLGWLALQGLHIQTMLFNISVVWLCIGLVGALWTLGRVLTTGSIISASHSLDIRFPTRRRNSGDLTVSPSVDNVTVTPVEEGAMETTHYYPLANEKSVEKQCESDYAHPYGFTVPDSRPPLVSQQSFHESYPNPEFTLGSDKNAALLLSSEPYSNDPPGTPTEWRHQHSSFGSLDYTLAWLTVDDPDRVDDPYRLSVPSSAMEGSQNTISEIVEGASSRPVADLPLVDWSDRTVGSATARLAVESVIMILCALLAAAGQFEFMFGLANVKPYFWGGLVTASYAVCGAACALLYFLFMLVYDRKRCFDLGAATMCILAIVAVTVLAAGDWAQLVTAGNGVLHAVIGASLLTLSGGLIVGVNQLGFSLYSLLLVRSLLLGGIGAVVMLSLMLVHYFAAVTLELDGCSVAIAACTGVAKSLAVLMMGMAIDMGSWKVYGRFALLPAYGGLYIWPLTAFMGPLDLQLSFIIAMLLIAIGMTPLVLRLEPERRLRRILTRRRHEGQSERHVNANS